MVKFYISTDSGCDMPKTFFQERNIAVIPMKYLIGEEEFIDTMDPVGSKAFFDKMRAGAVARTTQINAEDYIALWEPLLEHQLPIVHISLSSGISGTYDNGIVARKQFLEAHPEAQVFVVDGLNASMGYGLLLDRAADMRDEGKTAEECVQWLEDNRLFVNSWYTPEDLKYLHRGGRVSATSAVIGTMLDIKPILNVDDLGRLIAREKVKGRKKALRRMSEIVEEKVINPQEQTLYICHADCLEDAHALAETINNKLHFQRIFFSDMGPIIGAHTGPGLITLFFLGQKRYR